jgi:hypothetical protein
MDCAERTFRTVALAALLIAGPANVADAKKPRSALQEPIYQSVEDPPGQWHTRILVQDGGVFTFGGATSDRHSLTQSDQGFSVYFVRVSGGVRVREQPFIFPDGSRDHFDFEDYSCSTLKLGVGMDVVCRNRVSGQMYRSHLVSGALVSFDLKCFGELDRVCHYHLIEGSPLRPNKIQEP